MAASLSFVLTDDDVRTWEMSGRLVGWWWKTTELSRRSRAVCRVRCRNETQVRRRLGHRTPDMRRALHRVTPLIRSDRLSQIIDGNVYLKLDSLQPSGSFKIRGIGNAVREAVDGGATSVVSSSGGNAGLAAAYAAREYGLPITVVVPETTMAYTRTLLRNLGAEVLVEGSSWSVANEYAEILVEKREDAFMIHPFEGDSIHRGHATVAHEIFEQWDEATGGNDGNASRPDVVVTVVGGGGLLMGIMNGMKDVGWGDVTIIAGETEGAASFARSLDEGKRVTLPGITSIATSLGATTVSRTLFEVVREETQSDTPRVESFVTSDRQAIDGCVTLADTERILVEPACGVTVAYLLERAGHLVGKNVVLMICGGSNVTLSSLSQLSSQKSPPE